ncbi:hypothetical protein JX265_003578 [Neoarthrinium moseri]|uniref:BZIP domain-containing protein n=1 Tax=Neoarthrinium moseri TaxID=1658444 RepID=A0A9P9WSU8_9PEZI|nr:hypothetical protein JX265_003578 [Neoarthrinium moseri]
MADERNPVTDPGKRPRTRQRIHKAPPELEVPDINNDAAERKRVLNVLAQRRYRQRKRQHRLGKSASVSCEQATEAQKGDEITHHGQDGISETSTSKPAGACSGGVEENPALAVESLPGVSSASDINLNNWPTDSLVPTSLASQAEAETDYGVAATAAHLSFDPVMPDILTSEEPLAIDPSILDFSSDSSTTSGIVDSTQISWTFPDSYLLPMPELKLLQAFLRIASCLQCEASMWDLNAISPFNDPTLSPMPTMMATSWAPTESQRTVVHHPLFDFLPWPSARDRLIAIFSMPDEFRPAEASGPLALVKFAYDMEDSAEGMRIWGSSPCDTSGWEVGQVLFERWWFIFDRQIIEQSNRWRNLRGAPSLRLKGPRVENMPPEHGDIDP